MNHKVATFWLNAKYEPVLSTVLVNQLPFNYGEGHGVGGEDLSIFKKIVMKNPARMQRDLSATINSSFHFYRIFLHIPALFSGQMTHF